MSPSDSTSRPDRPPPSARFHFIAGCRQRLERVLDESERIFNAVLDADDQWWPFGFMKPRPQGRLSSRRVALLAVLYGLPAGLLAVIAAGALGDVPTDGRLFGFLGLVCFACFAGYRCTFAFFWNRRAERLRSGRRL